MYKLTLSYSERAAMRWVGWRYPHGFELVNLLWKVWANDPAADEHDDWMSRKDYTFHIPEHIAWQISELLGESLEGGHETLACFSKELSDKLLLFGASIV